jgi:DNA polymerase III alpha subunit
MVRRYGRETLEARRRLDHELAVIVRLGFAPYFVVVGEIMRHARARGIASVGRGSGAGALTAFLLGITNVDPLRYRLYFERFLHEKRPDHPDLDIDLCWVRRDEVIDHVYATYGRDRVAMISTHHLRARSAFREAAKAHGVANRRERWRSCRPSMDPFDARPPRSRASLPRRGAPGRGYCQPIASGFPAPGPTPGGG